MFKVNVKKHLICALILGIIGVIILALKVFKVLTSDLYTLLSLVFLLFAFALYLRPKMKIMKNKSDYLIEYREQFYNILQKTNKRFDKINEITFDCIDGVYYFKDLSFEKLNEKEFQIIAYEMVKDFVCLVYGKDEKLKEATIESFTVKIKKEDKIEEYKIIDNYKIM